MQQPSSKAQAWLAAARPRTLPAAVAPVLVGSGLAVGDDVFRLGVFAAALIGALAIQVAANFANDVSDATRGVDTTDRVGPARMVAVGRISTSQMWAGTWAAIGVAVLTGVYLIAVAGWVVAAIGVGSIIAMLTYVGGPIPYGYRALGEVSVFIFFGLVATVGTRYVHDRSVTPGAWWLGAVMGLLAAAILVVNNLRDRATDEATGKRTLAVVLGDQRTKTLYTVLVAAAMTMIGAGPSLGFTSILTLVALLAVPTAFGLINIVRASTSPQHLIPVLGATAQLQLLVGFVLAATSAIRSI